MSMMKTYQSWRSYRNTVAELKQLSDRELNDLGLARGDIYATARQASR